MQIDTDNLADTGAAVIAEVKRWYQSRTICLNLLGLVPSIFLLLQDNEALLQSLMKPWAYLLYIAVVHSINIILRCVTRKGIK